MANETDDRLDSNLIRDGFKQSSSDTTTYWRRDADGNLEERDTDGHWSKRRDSNDWEKDGHNSRY